MKNALWVKITAFLLLLVLLATAVGCGAVGILYYDFGGMDADRYWGNLYSGNMWQQMSQVHYAASDLFQDGNPTQQDFDNRFVSYTPENSNFCFRIFDDAGNLLYTSPNYSPDTLYTDSNNWNFNSPHSESDIRYEQKTFTGYAEQLCYFQMEDYLNTIPSSDYGNLSVIDQTLEYNGESNEYELTIFMRIESPVTQVSILIEGGIRADMQADDSFLWLHTFGGLLFEKIGTIIGLCIGSAVAALALFVYLLCVSGHKTGVDGIYLNWFNALPFDLFTIGMCVGFLPFLIAADWYYSNWSDYVIGGLLVLASVAMAILYVLSVAVRIKDRNVFRNTICWKVVVRCWKLVKTVFRWFLEAFIHWHLYWKAGLIWAALSFVELLFVAGFGRLRLFVLAVFEKMLLTPLILWLVIGMRKLEKGGQALADGDLSYKTDLEHMIPTLRAHGENLNRIGQGMERAVAEQTKSERMKAELITNVSHDLKTPLTSIINYVDLLKKEPVASDAAAEYIEVLDRQSRRMKKLTEDLVEASKASSGAMQVTLSPTNINLLLSQSLAEYSDKLEGKHLTPVFTPAENLPEIMADGRLLWRVFDNLLGNICKYALEGTRIYIASEFSAGSVKISFKNISRSALNISADELMERFVRGDSSRSTEGSGLGLSIAQGLTNLQGGNLQLFIDGDLFKAEITFPV